RINQALCKDRHTLQKLLKNLPDPKSESFTTHLTKLLDRLIRSENLVQSRTARLPAIQYPSSLPIVQKKAEIQKAIQTNQVVVISGETGSGKTTQIPKMCLEIGRGIRGKIGCTQPRRIAATSLATQVAHELKTKVGAAVGYKIRFSDQTREDTQIQFMTDGILLAEIQSDRFLNRYDTIIIDEAHERTLNIDFLLGYLVQLLPRRPELKLIVTSATIDVEKFSRSFQQMAVPGSDKRLLWNGNNSPPPDVSGAPIIEVSGRMYPVETRYSPIDEIIEEQGEITMIDLVKDAVEEILTETSAGDILVFMSGFQEIKEAADKLNHLQAEDFWILPLYGRLTKSEQNRIFQPAQKRKIIIATNIAETSITIPGIRYVVDTGRARISQYNTRSGTKGLPVKLISQSSANQRKGRCGRLSNGICIRLYSQEDFLSRDEYTTPEIQRSDLAEVILRMLTMKLGDISTFPFIDPPESAQIRAGIRSLKELGAIDDRKRLTATGKNMGAMPVDPRTARMILQAKEENMLYPVLIIASAISCQDPWERPEDKRTQADQMHAQFRSEESDLMTILNLWEYYHTTMDSLKTQGKMRKFCKKNFLSYHRIREWRDLHAQLVSIVTEKNWSLTRPDNWDYDAIHCSILSGYLNHIAHKKEKKVYEGTGNKELSIFPGSGQYKGRHEWIVAIELIETSKLFAHRVAKINPEWLESLAGHLCKKHWTQPRWDQRSATVVAWEKVTLYGFTLIEQRRVNYGPIDLEMSNTIFIREAVMEEKLAATLPFLKHNRSLIDDIHKMESQQRKRNILVNSDKMEQFYQKRIKGVSCLNDLKRIIKQNGGDRFLFMTKEDLMQQDLYDKDDLFPNYLTIGGKKCRLHYVFEPDDTEDGVTLELPWSLLNSLQKAPFEYLVPGLLQEKILWLLKNLPKSLRKKIFPIQEISDRVWDTMTSMRYASDQPDAQLPEKRNFFNALSEALFKITRVYIEPEQWDSKNLPNYLCMNFRLCHPQTGKIIQGRSLSELQQGSTKKEDAWDVLIKPHEHLNIQKWDFEPLLEEVRLSQSGDVPIWGFRTLLAKDGGLVLSLSKTLSDAEEESIHGIALLMEKELGEKLSWLHHELRFPPETLDQFQNLRDNRIDITVNLLQKKLGSKPKKLNKDFHADVQQRVYEIAYQGLLGCSEEMVLTEKSYDRRLEMIKKELHGLGRRVVDWIKDTMSTHQSLQLELLSKYPQQSNILLDAIAAELRFFFTAGCLSEIPFEQWRHMPRILRSYQRRIDKALADPAGEERKHDLTNPYQIKCRELWLAQENTTSKELWFLKRLRWMLEEFKVSVFSQDLKTAFPISAKRLDRYMEKHFRKKHKL
ncbi:MAG: ATP-dependent RNA helicase HrpA, partial [Deltaproteobacteria bacterium]|nr:ATP-dependent RNA helicase HrpA [Deltaproteobacteria bacterium]